MSTPSNTVSVIIPTFNRFPTVCRAIDSVLAQSYPLTTCIVVDDCSNDDTVKKLTEKYGSQIKLIQNEANKDKSYSRNQGVRASESEFVSFLDSDDTLTLNSVADRVSVFLEDKDFDGVAFGSRRNSDTRKTDGMVNDRVILDIEAYCHDKSALSTNSFLMRKQRFLEIGQYNETLSNKEDVELFLRLLSQVEFRFCKTEVTVVYSDADNRARENYKNIIKQGTQFSKVIKANKTLMSKYGALLKSLVIEEQAELLRALYYSGQFGDYLSTYKKGRKEGDNPKDFKFLKRYLLSMVRSRLIKKT